MPTTWRTGYLPSRQGFEFDNDFNNLSLGPIQFWGRCNGMAQVSVDYFTAGRDAPRVSVVDQGVRPQSGISAVIAVPGRVDLYTRRHGDRIAKKSMPLDGPVTHWQTVLDTQVDGTPSAAMWASNRTDMLARGKDGRVWHGWLDAERWDAERPCGVRADLAEDLGGPWDSSPAAAAPFANRLEIYVRASGGDLQFKVFDANAGWGGWSSLGHPPGVTLVGEPAAASRYGWMTAVVQGSDGAYWQIEWSGDRWQPWRSLGGRFTSSPAVATPFDGRLEAYGRGLDGTVYLAIWTRDRGWSGWSSLGSPPPGVTTDPPAAVGFYGGMLVFVRAGDDSIWVRRWRDGWQPWMSVEVPTTDEARRLNDAIYNRLIATTHAPLAGALASGIGFAWIGSVRNFITLRLHGNDQLFQWAWNDEVAKLRRFLGAGRPIPLSLLDSGGGWGHEVVAYGLDEGVPFPGSNLTGENAYIWVYDPNHPRCDRATIELNPRTRTIRSSSGESWRAAWVRDDYAPAPPPV